MANIHINGIIGTDYTYNRFLTDYANCGTEQIRLSIDSVGGDVNDGEKIAAFISEHSNRFLSVINTGDVASISASIFLSLERPKRFFDLSKGVFLIHNPFLDPVSLVLSGAETTANALSVMSDELQKTEIAIAKFIQKQTGADLDVIKGLMGENVPLTEEQITALNIATICKFQAVAFFNNNNNKMKDEDVKKMIDESNENMLSKFLAMFNRRTKFVAIMLTDSNGNQIEFPDVPEGSMPEVGDVGKKQDGTIPDGEVLMANGTTIIFEKGVVKEIKQVEQENPDELPASPDNSEALKAELERLKAEISNYRNQLTVVNNQLSGIKSQMIGLKPEEKTEGTKSNRKLSEIIK